MAIRHLHTLILTGLYLASPWAAEHVRAEDNYEKERQAMVLAIETDVRETVSYLEKDALNPLVLTAMGKVPRHEFVSPTARIYAYANHPLPIGYGQTISQPYIVAVMTDLLKVDQNDHVLEVGTGSGYQAAILATLADQVYSVEIIEPLAKQAAARLKKLGYDNVQIKVGDGYYGWQEHAPFDAIIVTAAASYVPPLLIEQLKPGGRIVIPVGSRFMVQQLVVVEKKLNNQLTTRQVMPVRFVPLTGGH